jgi:hypothetical protein
MPRAALLVLLVLLFGVTACGKRDLRGRSVRSSDGKTYLVVDDNNGGVCGGILVDRRAWPHPLHVAGELSPGVHQIACGNPDYFIEFAIEAGTTFQFDYWGP